MRLTSVCPPSRSLLTPFRARTAQRRSIRRSVSGTAVMRNEDGRRKRRLERLNMRSYTCKFNSLSPFNLAARIHFILGRVGCVLCGYSQWDGLLYVYNESRPGSHMLTPVGSAGGSAKCLERGPGLPLPLPHSKQDLNSTQAVTARLQLMESDG